MYTPVHKHTHMHTHPHKHAQTQDACMHTQNIELVLDQQCLSFHSYAMKALGKKTTSLLSPTTLSSSSPFVKRTQKTTCFFFSYFDISKEDIYEY